MDELGSRLTSVALRIAKAMREALAPAGLNLVQANGADRGELEETAALLRLAKTRRVYRPPSTSWSTLGENGEIPMAVVRKILDDNPRTFYGLLTRAT